MEKSEINVKKILEESCERHIDESSDLIDNGILDSLGIILFISKLKEYGYNISITRVDKTIFHSIEKLQNYVDSLERDDK